MSAMNKPRLSVNIDHSATLRQARLSTEPDPVTIAMMAELAGADGITAHLREDRRHVQDRDIHLLRRMVKTELNLEMAPTKEMLGIALEVKPDLVTLVPEKREELTTEGGLDVVTLRDKLKSYVATLKDIGIRVNLFIEPRPDVIKACHKIDSSGVELHTGLYANAADEKTKALELKKLTDASIMSKRLNLNVHAGHGLDYRNIKPILAIEEIEELAIGYSILARSVHVGIDSAVREMIKAIRG